MKFDSFYDSSLQLGNVLCAVCCACVMHTGTRTRIHTHVHTHIYIYIRTHAGCERTRHTLQHTTTHCNTLHHTTTHCNTLQHTVRGLDTVTSSIIYILVLRGLYCSRLQSVYRAYGVYIDSYKHSNAFQYPLM